MTTQPSQSYHKGAYMSLMKGLKELDLQGSGVPSDLVLSGDYAFPLAMNSLGQALMAASLYGHGRIVVLGNESYLTTFPALVENALTWLRGDGSNNLSVGVHQNIKAVADNLSKSSFQAKVVGSFSDKLGVGVYVTDAYSVGADVKDLVAFLKDGGGVLIAGQAWDWAAKHPKENAILQFPGNKLSAVAGIYFSAHSAEVEILPVSAQIPSSWKAVRVGKDFKDDLEFLLRGVSEFDLGSSLTASETLVHGPLAFPIGTNKDGNVFLSGTYYGKGRVIVVTHEYLLKIESLATFWTNAIDWLDQGRKGVVGIGRWCENFILANKSGFKCEETELRKDLSVYVCSSWSENHDEIQDFVAQGGGVLIAGHMWNWVNKNYYRNPMTESPANKNLNKMGISMMGVTMDGSGTHKAPVPSKAVKDTYHFRNLLRRFAGHVIQGDELTKHEEEHLEKLGKECVSFLKMKAYDSYFYTQVLSILTDVMKKSGMPKVTEKNPVSSPKDKALLRLGTELYNAVPDPDALLPYLMKDIPSMPFVNNRKIKINANTAEEYEWISTGLYLPPAVKTEMTMPANIVNKDWAIQISCQSDRLYHAKLKRAPDVAEWFPVTAEKMQVSILWGGLIYLIAPPKTKVEGAEIIVHRSVSAPYYKSGVTTAADWALLRTAPSPWAELEFDNIILTVPSDVVRDLEHPDEVATLWNDVMKGIADLAAIPHKFPRKERIVADVQISRGWFHSGYPVMMHSTDSKATELVNLHHARTIGLWGEYHELGHNQQRSAWEFKPHTTEATCNLWSVYVSEEVVGLKREKAHSSMTLKSREKAVDEYVQKGRKLSDWTEWVALETYLQLQGKFGWDAFKKLFAAYHEINDYPSDNDGKMNLYAETFSKIVDMNLSGFFKAWGWPIETATEEKLSNLRPWSDHPMAKYD